MENWQLICLNSQIPDSPGGRLSKQELVFLEECLAGNPNHLALIAVHHHCLETNSAWMDTMIIENSEELWAIIQHYPHTKAVTTGHIHQVMDVIIGSVRVLGTPSTCFQFKPESKTFSLDDTAPGYAADAMTVMADVYGLNYGWSRVDLNSTYISNMGGVYVLDGHLNIDTRIVNLAVLVGILNVLINNYSHSHLLFIPDAIIAGILVGYGLSTVRIEFSES
jgi:hypothetical protein